MSTDADLTLAIERVLDAPRAAVWRCWTEPALLAEWFCPKPWRVAEADLDPRPGGRMNVTMAGPDGERMENTGAYLEVVEGHRLVFTDAFAEGFVPRPESFITSTVDLADHGEGGTRMVWSARHATEETRDQHLEMGFEAGWNAAANQLEALARTLPALGQGEVSARVRTCLWFDGGGEEAARFYVSLLPDSRIEAISHRTPEGKALVVQFRLAGAPYMILNGGPHYKLNPAASISVLADTQGEIDRLWDALIEGGEAMRCGWLTDRWGVSWQIVPRILPQMFDAPDRAAAGRAQAAMMEMVKLDIATLEAAFAGQQKETTT